VATRWNLKAKSALFFSRWFSKLKLIHGKEEPGDSYPIINEWGGT
jgi:hypothetical protein